MKIKKKHVGMEFVYDGPSVHQQGLKNGDTVRLIRHKIPGYKGVCEISSGRIKLSGSESRGTEKRFLSPAPSDFLPVFTGEMIKDIAEKISELRKDETVRFLTKDQIGKSYHYNGEPDKEGKSFLKVGDKVTVVQHKVSGQPGYCVVRKEGAHHHNSAAIIPISSLSIVKRVIFDREPIPADIKELLDANNSGALHSEVQKPFYSWLPDFMLGPETPKAEPKTFSGLGGEGGTKENQESSLGDADLLYRRRPKINIGFFDAHIAKAAKEINKQAMKASIYKGPHPRSIKPKSESGKLNAAKESIPLDQETADAIKAMVDKMVGKRLIDFGVGYATTESTDDKSITNKRRINSISIKVD